MHHVSLDPTVVPYIAQSVLLLLNHILRQSSISYAITGALSANFHGSKHCLFDIDVDVAFRDFDSLRRLVRNGQFERLLYSTLESLAGAEMMKAVLGQYALDNVMSVEFDGRWKDEEFDLEMIYLIILGYDVELTRCQDDRVFVKATQAWHDIHSDVDHACAFKLEYGGGGGVGIGSHLLTTKDHVS
ncbi:hypothetical protein ADUPG1_005890, partial [Aduncisulcus paluster]